LVKVVFAYSRNYSAKRAHLAPDLTWS
jgi:hypothetical protein